MEDGCSGTPALEAETSPEGGLHPASPVDTSAAAFTERILQEDVTKKGRHPNSLAQVLLSSQALAAAATR